MTSRSRISNEIQNNVAIGDSTRDWVENIVDNIHLDVVTDIDNLLNVIKYTENKDLIVTLIKQTRALYDSLGGEDDDK